IGGFARGQGTLCLILGLFYAIALVLIGLNHGFLIGFVAGILSFIPYLGSLTGMAVATCVAIAQFWPRWAWIGLVPAIFFFGQSIGDYVLSPYLVGRRVNLNPVWVLFSLFAFGYLFGLVGLLIAVPVAAAIGVLLRFAFTKYYASPLMPLRCLHRARPLHRTRGQRDRTVPRQGLSLLSVAPADSGHPKSHPEKRRDFPLQHESLLK